MLRLPLHVTHNLLAHDEIAFDCVFGRNARGEQTMTQEADRTVRMNLQPASDRLVALLPEGAQTDGAKVMHTDAPISVADNGQGRQTFVRHGGQLWKAWAVQDWSPHSTLGRWILTRYVNTDGGPKPT